MKSRKYKMTKNNKTLEQNKLINRSGLQIITKEGKPDIEKEAIVEKPPMPIKTK
jgi:hypothetical protein